MTRLLKYLKSIDYVFLAIAAGLVVLQVYLELKIPDFTAELTTLVTQNNAPDLLAKTLQNGGLMILCAFSSLVCSIICSFLISSMASHLTMSIRDEIYKHILSFSSAEIHRFHTSSLITRTTTDVVQLQNFTNMGVQMLIKAPVMAIWGICKISATKLSWTMATMISVIILVVCVSIAVFICLPRFKKIQKLTDELNARTSENITGVRVIRAFNAEKFQDEKFAKVNKDITLNNMVSSKTMSIIMPLINLIMNSLILAIYWIGVIIVNDIPADIANIGEVIFQRATLFGHMISFTSYAMQIIMAFMMLVMVFILLPRCIISCKRINEVLDVKSDIQDGEFQDEEVKEEGKICLKNVFFSFTGDDHYALKDINLEVNKGETVAIIGPTGCGKTTLINLMMRYYDATLGEVKVDDHNVREYRLDDLRKRFSIATQKAMLFKGTIKENIAFGKKDVDEEKLNKAMEIASCDFVSSLEKREDSEVAQGGSNFSGGQKQRLSIARTLYKASEIMVFDDTFSALDYKTDFQVRKKIHDNLKDKTVIIVAQRIGTIKNADKIVVMEEGKIVATGKHEELLNTCPAYKEIAMSQLSKEELQ